MKAFWDTSALVEVLIDSPAARETFNAKHERLTRAHTLAETFAQLTGGRLVDANGDRLQMTPDDAVNAIVERAGEMTVISLDAAQTLAAMKKLTSAVCVGQGFTTCCTFTLPNFGEQIKSTRSTRSTSAE